MFLRNFVSAVFVLVSLNASAQWNRPNFDSVACYVDDPQRANYTTGQVVEFYFPHVDNSKSGKFSVPGTLVFTGEVNPKTGSDEVAHFENVTIELELLRVDRAVGVMSVGSVFTYDNAIVIGRKNQLDTIVFKMISPLKDFTLPVPATGTCLYLDGTIHKGGAGVHN